MGVDLTMEFEEGGFFTFPDHDTACCPGGGPVRSLMRYVRGSSVMAAKSFMMMFFATLVGPAIGVALFVLLNNL
jgi:hypothetical protein